MCLDVVVLMLLMFCGYCYVVVLLLSHLLCSAFCKQLRC